MSFYGKDMQGICFIIFASCDSLKSKLKYLFKAGCKKYFDFYLRYLFIK